MTPDLCRRSIHAGLTMRECGRPAVIVYLMGAERWPLCERHDTDSARARAEHEPQRYSVELPRA